MRNWGLSLIRFVNRETINCGITFGSLAVYRCKGGFLAIWVCNCGSSNHEARSKTAVNAANLATAGFRLHCEAAHHEEPCESHEMQILTDAFDSTPHKRGDLVFDVRNDWWQLEVRFQDRAYYIYLLARDPDGKPTWTRLTAYGGTTPADVRLLALKYWGEMANAPP